MNQPNLTPDNLLTWHEITSKNWRDLVNAHPAILALRADIRESETVAKVLQHIVAVELRFAQRLAALPESDYSDVKYSNADEIYATHKQAIDIVRVRLADPAYDWAVEIEFNTITAGKVRATRKDVFLHLLLHGIRHYAQLATLIRQHGFKPNWPMDYLYMSMSPRM